MLLIMLLLQNQPSNTQIWVVCEPFRKRKTPLKTYIYKGVTDDFATNKKGSKKGKNAVIFRLK
jgi:hypothetical protein